MKCPHCLENFHDNPQENSIGEDADGFWRVTTYKCPACTRYVMYLDRCDMKHVGGLIATEVVESILVRPKGSSRPPTPPEVPPEIAEDYREACLVLANSPKASAALSRRCLQNMLRRDGNVKPSALSNEIRQVISSPGFPSYLAQQLDAVREVGNLAAHATKDEHTGEILPVESEEAEWNLDVIELLFDFYYVQPAKVREKTTAINEKLKKAGRKTIGREQATDEVK